MTITPATRVSQALHRGGLPTTEPGSKRQGNKVRNACSPATLNVQRQSGMPVVTVSPDFDDRTLSVERSQDIIDILTAAGYRAERSDIPGSLIVRVWEPGWEAHVGKEIPFRIAGILMDETPGAAPSLPVADLYAVKMRDGMTSLHAAGCPQIEQTPPGKVVPVQGRTIEVIVTELIGKTISKGGSAKTAARLLRPHDCITDKLN